MEGPGNTVVTGTVTHTTMRPLLLCLSVVLSSGGILIGSAGQAPAGGPLAQPPAYRLEAGDQIEIRFFYNPELNEKVDIRPDGRISMPLVGQILAAGETVESLTTHLTGLYKPILKQAELTVQVRSFVGRKFIVGGDVQRPGVFPLIGGQTILGAIMEAGGLKSTSKRDRVILVRRSPAGTPETIEISLKRQGTRFPGQALMEIQPYDMVLVDESGVAKANRFVEQNITKMLPVVLTTGFTYLFGGTFIR